tara:strand:+ start:276 stop:1391 length:1116 start_codon:yes stop_codon:yes gene_type:complete
MTKARDTANLVSSKTGVAVTISGDPIFLGIGNTEHIRINANGTIGIGTTTPTGSDTSIHVYSPEQTLLRLESSDSKSGIQFIDDATGAQPPLIYGMGDELTIWTEFVERFRVRSNGKVGIGSTQPTLGLDINKAAESGVYLGNPVNGYKLRANVTSANNYGFHIEDEAGNDLYSVRSNGADADPNTHVFYKAGGSESARFNSSGNLVFPAGQGIDFSATTEGGGATSTSELFHDYEEGTWTPTKHASNNFGGWVRSDTTFSSVNAYYTKIGRMVYLYGSFDIGGNTGNIAQGDYLDLTTGSFPYAPITSDITTIGDVWWYNNLGGNKNAHGQAILVQGSGYCRFFTQVVVGTIGRNVTPVSFSLRYITNTN